MHQVFSVGPATTEKHTVDIHVHNQPRQRVRIYRNGHNVEAYFVSSLSRNASVTLHEPPEMQRPYNIVRVDKLVESLAGLPRFARSTTLHACVRQRRLIA